MSRGERIGQPHARAPNPAPPLARVLRCRRIPQGYGAAAGPSPGGGYRPPGGMPAGQQQHYPHAHAPGMGGAVKLLLPPPLQQQQQWGGPGGLAVRGASAGAAAALPVRPLAVGYYPAAAMQQQQPPPPPVIPARQPIVPPPAPVSQGGTVHACAAPCPSVPQHGFPVPQQLQPAPLCPSSSVPETREAPLLAPPAGAAEAASLAAAAAACPPLPPLGGPGLVVAVAVPDDAAAAPQMQD